MRAVRYKQLGRAADVLTVVDIEPPRPGPGEVRVQLAFSGVNPTDWKRRLLGPEVPAFPGQIPHQDGAGEIDEVGAGVPDARMGERVWVFHAAWNRSGGTAAQYVTVPSDQAITLPANTSLEMGASLGIPYITAHRALAANEPLDGSTVLVTAGAGAVGHEAVQLGANLSASWQELAPGGVIVSHVFEDKNPQIPVRALMTLNSRMRFILVYNMTPEQIRSATDNITSAHERGRLQALPTTVLPMSDVVRAHELVEAGTLGRVLLNVRA